jgi:hypothetical protein
MTMASGRCSIEHCHPRRRASRLCSQTTQASVGGARRNATRARTAARRYVLLLIALVAAWPAVAPAQGHANVSGMWKAVSVDPPVPAGRGRGAAGGGIAGPYAETMLAQAPDAMIITQTATAVTVQIGSAKIVYTLDDKTTELPPGDVMAFKSRAHWDGATLHLHYKQGMNWGRDVLTLSGATLTVVRDLESGGQSTTRTLTYSKN